MTQRLSDCARVVVGRWAVRRDAAADMLIEAADNEEHTLVLEACWTFLWNITDETPANSHRFVDDHGRCLPVTHVAVGY